MTKNYIFGSIHPVGKINEFIPGPLEFQGKIVDKLLMPKQEQIPFIPNQSICTLLDDTNGATMYIYNISDDKWHNPKDKNDIV